VINTNLLPILHRFRDIAVDRSKIAIFYYPSCLTPPAEGFPGTISMKFSVDVNKYRRNIAENLNRLSRAHERYRQTTDGRAIAYSEREREFTSLKTKRIATRGQMSPIVISP